MACCSDSEDSKVILLYSCSGVANTGYLADQVYRKLARDKVGSGTCLAAIGADLSGFLASAKGADENVIIDGCPIGCGKRSFENKGLPYTQYITTDFDVKKGQTLITQEIIQRVAGEIKAKIEGGNG